MSVFQLTKTGKTNESKQSYFDAKLCKMRIFSVARLTEDRFPEDRETDSDSGLYHKFLLGKQVQNQTFGKETLSRVSGCNCHILVSKHHFKTLQRINK